MCVDEAGVVVMSAFNTEGEQQRPLAGRFDGTEVGGVTVSMGDHWSKTRNLAKVHNAKEEGVGRWNDDSEADRFTTKNNSKHWKKQGTAPILANF